MSSRWSPTHDQRISSAARDRSGGVAQPISLESSSRVTMPLVAVAVAHLYGHAGARLDHGVEGGPQRVLGPDLELEGADLGVADPALLGRLAGVLQPLQPPVAVHHHHHHPVAAVGLGRGQGRRPSSSGVTTGPVSALTADTGIRARRLRPRSAPRKSATKSVAGSASSSSGRVLLQVAALAEDGDAVAHLDRLVDVVGDEHDRLADLLLEAEELVLEAAAHDRVDRPERLVHEHDRRGRRPGPGPHPDRWRWLPES